MTSLVSPGLASILLLAILNVAGANYSYVCDCEPECERPFVWWERHCSYVKPCRQRSVSEAGARPPWDCGTKQGKIHGYTAEVTKSSYSPKQHYFVEFRCPSCGRWSRVYMCPEQQCAAPAPPPVKTTPVLAPQKAAADLSALNMQRSPSAPYREEEEYSGSPRLRGHPVIPDASRALVMSPPIIQDAQWATGRSNLQRSHPSQVMPHGDDEPAERT